MLDNAPYNWWQRFTPSTDRLCYRSKSRMLNAFLSVNEGYFDIDLHRRESPAEFDSVNHKYGTKARTLAEAIWAAVPVKRRPYCLEDIDIEALNNTDVGRRIGGFRMPDWYYEKKFDLEQEAYYRKQYGLDGSRKRPMAKRKKMLKRGSHVNATSTKGWGKSAPSRVGVRRTILEKCGRGAFLNVSRSVTGKSVPQFPVVAKSAARSSGKCQVDCRGLWAAKQRASQSGYASLVRRATNKAKAAGCRWAKGE